jgi:hypothetical protein
LKTTAALKLERLFGANIPSNGSTKDTAPVVHGTVSSSLLSDEQLVVYRDGVKLVPRS